MMLFLGLIKRINKLNFQVNLKILIICFCVFGLQGCGEQMHDPSIEYHELTGSAYKSGYFRVKRDAHFKKITEYESARAIIIKSQLARQYVSIAELTQRYFVIANYVDLLLLDRKENTLCTVKVSGDFKKHRINSLQDLAGALRQEAIVDYNPTGVFVDDDKDIYVANYKGNNILRGKVDTENCSAHFVGSYSSKNSGGPENVFVDKNQDILVSANYDRGTVTAFRVSDGTELWSSSVGQAHGVAIMNNVVYATGLTERKIYKLNLENGRHIASKGSLGWDPMSSQFMWPTSISPLRSGQLIVSDAQSGYISIVDPESLDVVRFTGGNGPSFNLFNYPYAATSYSNGVAIVSANRGQILFLNQSVSRVIEEFRLDDDGWPTSAKKAPPFGSGWVGYVYEKGSPISIRGANYKMGFGHLHGESEGPILRVPDIWTLYNFGSYIYFLQGANVGYGASIFFSSSSTTLIGIVSRPGGPSLILSRRIPIDSWLVGNSIINSAGKFIDLDELKAELFSRASKIDSVLNGAGWISKEDLYKTGDYRVAEREVGFKEFVQYLDRVFLSAAGREFKLAYDRCSTDACDVKALQSAADKYYSETKGFSYVNIDEFILVGMLSGLRSTENHTNQLEIVFDSCNIGKWYPGFGPETIATRSLNDYFSAHDLETSVICLSRSDGSPFSIRSILFGWYSVDEAAQAVEILGLTDAYADEDEVSLGVFEIPSPFEVGGYQFSTIKTKNSQVFSRFKIRLVRGGAQNRLILRSLTVDELRQSTSVGAYSKMAGTISQSIQYGVGTNKLSGDSVRSLLGAASALGRADSAHCGNYALMFVAGLMQKDRWKIVDLAALDGRVHTVVEVDESDGFKTYDPTLGITYSCSIDELVGGGCDYDSVVRASPINPALLPFEGAGFFYGAKAIRSCTKEKDLLDLYR